MDCSELRQEIIGVVLESPPAAPEANATIAELEAHLGNLSKLAAEEAEAKRLKEEAAEAERQRVAKLRAQIAALQLETALEAPAENATSAELEAHLQKAQSQHEAETARRQELRQEISEVVLESPPAAPEANATIAELEAHLGNLSKLAAEEEAEAKRLKEEAAEAERQRVAELREQIAAVHLEAPPEAPAGDMVIFKVLS